MRRWQLLGLWDLCSIVGLSGADCDGVRLDGDASSQLRSGDACCETDGSSIVLLWRVFRRRVVRVEDGFVEMCDMCLIGPVRCQGRRSNLVQNLHWYLFKGKSRTDRSIQRPF